MANVQPDKFTRIAHLLLQAIYRSPMSANQIRVALCVIRNSYGWSRKDWPFMNARLISLDAEMPIESVRTAVQKLRRSGVLKSHSIEKDFDKWDLGSVKSPTPADPPTPVKSPTPLSVKSPTPPAESPTPFKELKKGFGEKGVTEITRNGPAVREIFDFWNEQKITIHRVRGSHEPTIRAKLKDYTLEEIKAAISNYSSIFHDPSKRWSHPWTLKDFLTRTKGLDRFIPVNFGTQKFMEKDPRGSVTWAKTQDALDRDQRDPVHRLTRWYQLELGHEKNPGWDAAAYETVFREADKWHAALGPLQRTAQFIKQTVKRLRDREGFNASWLKREVAEWGAGHRSHGRR